MPHGYEPGSDCNPGFGSDPDSVIGSASASVAPRPVRVRSGSEPGQRASEAEAKPIARWGVGIDAGSGSEAQSQALPYAPILSTIAAGSGNSSPICLLCHSSTPSAMTMKLPPRPRIISISASGNRSRIAAARPDAFGS